MGLANVVVFWGKRVWLGGADLGWLFDVEKFRPARSSIEGVNAANDLAWIGDFLRKKSLEVQGGCWRVSFLDELGRNWTSGHLWNSKSQIKFRGFNQNHSRLLMVVSKTSYSERFHRDEPFLSVLSPLVRSSEEQKLRESYSLRIPPSAAISTTPTPF